MNRVLWSALSGVVAGVVVAGGVAFLDWFWPTTVTVLDWYVRIGIAVAMTNASRR